jgi:glycosyltransferase involved in cell wall biosynthesis
MKDLVSICIATHNRKQSLRKTIESVLNQDYEDLEIIIVDDNSNDGTDKMVRKYSDINSRIKYFKNQENRGLAYNRNLGINNATGKYFTFIDDDDYWHPSFVSDFVHLSQDYDENVIFFGGYRELFKDATVEYFYDVDMYLSNAIRIGYTPPVASQFYFLKTVKDIKGYNQNIKSGVDHDLWLKLSENKNIRVVSSRHGYAFVNNDTNDQTRMTLNFDERKKKLLVSFRHWEKCLNQIEDNFNKHFKISYDYYIMSKFSLILIRKKEFEQALKLFINNPFKIKFIIDSILILKRKIVKFFKYYVLKKRYIRFVVKNTFPTYKK